MKKVEADTLEEAYLMAATQLACSITNIKYEIIQHPSEGIFGFLKKKAIIVAVCKEETSKIEKPNDDKENITKENIEKNILYIPNEEERVASEIISVVKEENSQILQDSKTTISSIKDDTVLENFFAVAEKKQEKELTNEENLIDDEEIKEESIVYDELALLIEDQLKELLSHSCFDIDIVEVDVVDNTALIFIDGEDAALLIGKEGYRYNALSYMIFNWLHSKYELFIKLEIAQFLTSQQEMIKNYMKPVIENVEKNGKGRTRHLDGILIQIALEQLREVFPNKYVAVKTDRKGKKFIVINEFNSKSNA